MLQNANLANLQSIRCATYLTIWLLAIVIMDHIESTLGVVVDGTKKSDLSATRKQVRNEKVAIGSYNIKTCGIADPNYNEHEFINMAREGQFPWIASFQIKILGNSTMKEQRKAINKDLTIVSSPKKRIEDLHFCSGAFISDKWILSAAHCFAGDTIRSYVQNNKLKVVAGSHKVSSLDRLNEDLVIKRIYYHPKFDRSQPIGFDIALVELQKRVLFSNKRVQDGIGEQTARVAGWGLSNANDIHSMPSKLLTTDILLSNQTECIEQYVKRMKSNKPAEQKAHYDDFICANYKDSRDTCQSDSGGPLMEYANNKAVAIGIVSYGIGCATKGVPGVYTRVSAYIDWIQDVTSNKKLAKVDFKVLEATHTEAAATKASEW